MKIPAIIGIHVHAHMLASIILSVALFRNLVIPEVFCLQSHPNSGFLLISIHSCNGFNACKKFLPFLVREYSVLGGISLKSFLFSRPLFSNFFKDDASVEGLIPSNLTNKSLFLSFSCLEISSKINKFHFLLIVSIRS